MNLSQENANEKGPLNAHQAEFLTKPNGQLDKNRKKERKKERKKV